MFYVHQVERNAFLINTARLKWLSLSFYCFFFTKILDLKCFHMLQTRSLYDYFS